MHQFSANLLKTMLILRDFKQLVPYNDLVRYTNCKRDRPSNALFSCVNIQELFQWHSFC